MIKAEIVRDLTKLNLNDWKLYLVKYTLYIWVNFQIIVCTVYLIRKQFKWTVSSLKIMLSYLDNLPDKIRTYRTLYIFKVSKFLEQNLNVLFEW